MWRLSRYNITMMLVSAAVLVVIKWWGNGSDGEKTGYWDPTRNDDRDIGRNVGEYDHGRNDGVRVDNKHHEHEVILVCDGHGDHGDDDDDDGVDDGDDDEEEEQEQDDDDDDHGGCDDDDYNDTDDDDDVGDDDDGGSGHDDCDNECVDEKMLKMKMILIEIALVMIIRNLLRLPGLRSQSPVLSVLPQLDKVSSGSLKIPHMRDVLGPGLTPSFQALQRQSNSWESRSTI